MMRQDHQQQIATAQRQVLSQSARQLVELITLSPAEYSDRVERCSAENPFLSAPPIPRRSVVWSEQLSPGPSLFAHVLAELPLLVRAPADLSVARRLAEGLDERGFLVESVSDIAADLKLSVAKVEAILAKVQGIEPVGLFSRSVGECLALQLRAQGELDEVAIRLLCDLDGVAALGAVEFARRQGARPERVMHLLSLIGKATRNPAAAFGETAPVALPELHFERQGKGWTVSSIQAATPQVALRHTEFALALAAARDAEERQDLRRLWREAQMLHQAASARLSTMLELGKSLVLLQQLGLDSGLTSLAPLTQREVAARLSVHQSTVSRLVRHRFVSVEGRIVQLARFFERPRPLRDGQQGTRSAVLAALQKLVTSHPASGLSDLAITRELDAVGIHVTRRRLAKYRTLLGIPPSQPRRGRASR